MSSPRPVVALQDWHQRAACRDVNEAVFFGNGHCYDEAKAVCRRCPVKADCAAYALKVESGFGMTRRHGVWGGLSPLERYHLERCRTGRCRHQHGESP